MAPPARRGKAPASPADEHLRASGAGRGGKGGAARLRPPDMHTDLAELQEAVVEGERAAATALARSALAEGIAARRILEEALIPGMARVGDLFKRREFYVPEMLMAARAMKACLEILRPDLVAAKVEPIGCVVGATVAGDLHDIGKNLVLMMLEGAGFRVVDLGVDCPPERVVAAVGESGARLVCLSALLTTTMPAMRDTIAALDAAGLRGRVGILVGGASVTQAYADEIGADGYAPDAASAVDAAKRVLAHLAAS